MNATSRDSLPRPRHLLTLEGIDRDYLTALLDRAAALRVRFAADPRPLDLLDGRTVVNLFFEPSTRTRTSFELAARRLGAIAINFDIASSSTRKGETLEDTIATIEAMGCDAFVVRHAENGTPQRLAAHTRHASVLNAGDGNHAHPTQGLTDLLTLRDRKDRIDGLRIAICGDIRHSRVARSAIHGLQTLGAASIRLCGPAALLPDSAELPGCDLGTDFDAAIDGVDAIMMLRLQKERMAAAMPAGEDDYFKHYGLDTARLARAQRDAVVLHPGPINRGVEIAAEVADGPQSVILDQVHNGVFVRMAVLASLLEPMVSQPASA